MVLGEVLVALLILTVFSAFGLKVLKWMRIAQSPSLPSFLFGWSIGLGTAALLTLFLGLVRLLYPVVAWAVLALMLAVSHREARQLVVSFFVWTRSIRTREFYLVLLAIGALASGVFSLVNALSPPVFYDTLTAHLAHPNWYIINHSIRFRPYNVYTNYPLNIEMVYTFAMLLIRGDQVAKLLDFLFGVTSALLVFSIGVRFLGRRAAAIASTVFYLTPSVGLLSGLATHDLGLLLFEAASVYALFIWFGGSEKRWLFLSAVLCGLAMGTKYTGLYFVTTCILVMISRLAFDRKGSGFVLKSVVAFALVALAVSSPWFIKSFVYTGNPTYPALSNLFGTTDFQKVSFGLTSGKAALDPLHFLRLPWDMTLRPARFGSASQIGPLFILFLIPFLFTRRVNRELRYMLELAAILFVFWAVTMLNTRYYLAGLALFSLWIGYSCDRYMVKTAWAWLLWAVLGCGLLFNVISTVNLNTDLFDPGAVVFGRQSKEEYLTERIDHYPVILYANRHLPPDSKVLFVGEARTYYIRKNYDASSAYDKAIIVELVKQSTDLHDLLERLKREGYTHIIYNGFEAHRLNEEFNYFDWESPEEKALFDQFTSTRLETVYRYGESYLFRITY
jgi:hypothetical protein